ncbi:hypothetical protein [Prosthecobacter sp.]|uniref:hypothetical protein n=1 Tax=Prosthecobacter sp. TaxID=1965333 RepID=UPI003783A77F
MGKTQRFEEADPCGVSVVVVIFCVKVEAHFFGEGMRGKGMPNSGSTEMAEILSDNSHARGAGAFTSAGMETHDSMKREAEVNPYAAPASGATTAGLLTADGNDGAKRGWWPGVSLLMLALLAGLGWRMELEMTTGWASMDWIGRFHWAIPAGVLAFIAWVLWVTRGKVKRRGAFAAALLGYGIMGYFVVQGILLFVCGRQLLLFDDEEGSGYKRLLVEKQKSFLLLALVPVLFWLLCRGFGVRVRLGSVLACTVLFMLSWPLADLLFTMVEGRSEMFFIHAVKSGYVIPPLMLCLGWPVLRARGREGSSKFEV